MSKKRIGRTYRDDDEKEVDEDELPVVEEEEEEIEENLMDHEGGEAADMIEQAAAMLAEAAAMLRGGGEEEVAEAPSPVEMAADGSASSAYTDSPEYAALLAERDVLKMKLASGKQVVNYVAQLVELGMEPKEASEKMSAFRNNAQRKAYVDATAEHMGGGDPPAWTGEQPAPGREPATPSQYAVLGPKAAKLATEASKNFDELDGSPYRCSASREDFIKTTLNHAGIDVNGIGRGSN